jgi:protein-S-isoprenylcysteine O-methyltransferase Ste14
MPSANGPVVQFGRHKVSGPPAVAIVIGIPLLIAGLILYFRPSPNWPVTISGALWIAFVIYWSKAARNSAPAQSSESTRSRAVHQDLMNVSFLLVFIPVPGLRGRFLPQAPYVVPLGLTLQCACFALAVWARRHLGRNWSGEISMKIDHRLITTGPYALVRHPIYTAMLGMFAGAAIVSGQWHALLGVAVISFAYWRKIRLEEPPLLETFGDAWVAYRRRTRALIPWVL